MSERAAVLVVDDDALILRAVQRSMFPSFDIVTAASSIEAIDILHRETKFAVIVADLRMPGGDGVELLQYTRARHPDTVRVLLSGVAQLRDAVAAVNEGQVFRFLTKPFDLGVMRLALTAAVEQHHLLTAERVLLEETLQGTIKVLTDMLAIVQPVAFGRALRMRVHATDLAVRNGMTRKWEVEVAAMLSQIGSITLDADTLNRWYHCEELSSDEESQIERLPSVAEALIADIPRLDSVRAILRRQYEPANAPDLPMGAAILAIARDYDLLITQGKTPDEALTIMDARGAKYDTGLMNHFRSLRGGSSATEVVQEMQLRHVQESMTFAADVHSANGLLLIARGQRVTPALISRLRLQSFALTASMQVRMIVAAVPSA